MGSNSIVGKAVLKLASTGVILSLQNEVDEELIDVETTTPRVPKEVPFTAIKSVKVGCFTEVDYLIAGVCVSTHFVVLLTS